MTDTTTGTPPEDDAPPTDRGTRDVGAVLFDIDGTLVDSNYLHVLAFVGAFADVGHPADAWQIHRRVGMGSELLLGELLGEQADEDLIAQAKERHSARYAELAPLQRTFAEARELVRAVADRGARTVLATSADPAELERLLAILELEDVLTGTVSAKDVQDAKPEPDLVQAALDAAGVPADRAVMLGDSVWDVQAAVRAGVTCVAVLTGGTTRADLLEAGAAAVYDNTAALLEALDNSPLAATWRAAR